jgi:cytidine deaminase
MKTFTVTLHPLVKGDDKLIEAAREAVIPLVDERFEGERITSVGAAARWKDGKVFTGANVRHPSSPASCTCAELVTLGKAYTETHNRELEVIVAYWYDSEDQENVINPCGRCRDYLRLYGNPWVIVRDGDITSSKDWGRTRLNDLYTFTNDWGD